MISRLAANMFRPVLKALRIHSLRGKLLLGVSLVMAPLLALILVAYQQQFDQRQQELMDDQLRTARAAGVLIDSIFDETLALGRSFAIDPTVQNRDPQVVESYLNEQIKIHPHFENIVVTNSDGSVIAISPVNQNKTMLDIADREYFREVLRTDGAVISNILISRATQNPTVVLATPLHDDAGQINGVFLVSFSLEFLHSELDRIGLVSGQDIILTDPVGRAAFYGGVQDLSWEQRDLSQWWPIQKAIETGKIEAKSLDSPLLSQQRIGAFSRTADHGWVVGVTIPLEAALVPAQELLRTWLLALLLVGAASTVMAMALAGFLVRPLQQLILQTRALGRGELGRRVEIKSGDELEMLGDSFNDMAARLQSTLGDLQTVLDSTENGIIMLGLDGRFRFANRRFGELLGLSSGLDCGKLYWKDCLALLWDRVSNPESLQNSMEHHFRHPEERVLDELVIGMPVFRILRRFSGPAFSGQQIVGRIEIFTDVTDERKEEWRRGAIAETARALVEELEIETVANKVVDQTMQLFGADSVGLWFADVDRRELRVLALKGFPPEVSRLFDCISFDSTLNSARAAATGEPQIIEDLNELSPELEQARKVMERMGQRSVVAYPLKVRGHLVGVMTFAKKEPHPFGPGDEKTLAILSDIFAVAIENARLFQQAKDALHLRDEFLSAAAHELRTPVTALKGFAQLLLKEGEVHTPIERRALEAIDRQCNRISRLAVDLFRVSEYQESKREFNKIPVDLRDIAEQVQKEMSHELETSGGALSLRVPDQPVTVESDRTQISEVFENLIDTAIGRSLKQPHVEIEVSILGDQAIGMVRDHGALIPPERFPHVFEPFYEPVPAGAPGYKGIVLLGPYISRQIIEGLGGKIWFESEEGEGSTFYFALPLAGAEKEEHQAA